MNVVNTGALKEAETVDSHLDRGRRFSSVHSYGASFATEFSVMLVQIALYKLAATWLGQTGFSEYALARRVLALLQPMTMLGFGVGLPRYLALADGHRESSRSSQYLSATFLCVGSFTALIVVMLLAFPHWFSYLLFGATQHGYLLPPLCVMLAGMALHSILYSYLRGRLAVGRANWLQLINSGLVPVAVFALFHKDVASLLWYLGLAWIGVTAVVLSLMRLSFSWQNSFRESSELLRYGLPRVPGDFALMALLALPAIFAAHLGGIHQAGWVAFGLSIVNMIASVFSPTGIVLLPRVSRALASGDFQPVHREIVLIRGLVLAFGSTIVLLIELLGGRLIRIYLGESYAAAQPLVEVLVIGALPLAFYYAMRNVLDAVHQKAVNTFNLVISLVVFLAGAGAGMWWGSSRSILWSSASALTVLALLTQGDVHKVLQSLRLSPQVIDPSAEADQDEVLHFEVGQ